MPTRYVVAPHPHGWAVLEDDTPVQVCPDRADADDIARLLQLVVSVSAPLSAKFS